MSYATAMSEVLFRSSWEKAWFETWFLLSRELCGDELSDLFAVTVTQLSTQDAALRQAILAVGSLKFTLDQASDVSSAQNYRTGSQYETALSRYGTALRAVSAMPANESTISTILLCCIVFICFDLLDENQQSVHSHIQHGSRILQQFLSSRSQKVNLRTCISSPAPYVINDSIIQIFQRCISISYVHRAPQLMSQRSTPQDASISEPSAYLGSQMPGEFQDLREAVKWLDLIQNAFLTTLFAPDPAMQLQGTLDDNENWQKERIAFLKVLHDWSVAFCDVERLAERKRSTDRERYGQASLLRMQWHNSYIFIYTSHYRDYKALLEMENMFRSIVNLAKALPNEQSKGKLVTPLTISGPILPLFVTANKCRNSYLRLAAEKILGQLTHRVEGLWDSRAALALVQWARKTEDAYAAQSTDPEEVWNKVRDRYIIFKNRENQAFVGAKTSNGTSSVYREEMISW